MDNIITTTYFPEFMLREYEQGRLNKVDCTTILRIKDGETWKLHPFKKTFTNIGGDPFLRENILNRCIQEAWVTINCMSLSMIVHLETDACQLSECELLRMKLQS